MSSRNSPTLLSQPQSSEMSTPEKSQCPDNGMFFNKLAKNYTFQITWLSIGYGINNDIPNAEAYFNLLNYCDKNCEKASNLNYQDNIYLALTTNCSYTLTQLSKHAIILCMLLLF